MERQENFYYTVSEFAKLFDIKRDTLIYYDKIGLFSPSHTGENGYRYYSARQIETFWTLFSLRELNVPIASLLEYFRNPNPQDLMRLCAEQLNKAEEQIKRLQTLKRVLSDTLSATQDAFGCNSESFSICTLPERYCIYSKVNDTATNTDTAQWEDFYTEFVTDKNLHSATLVGSVISLQDISAGLYGRVEKLFAFSDEPTENVLPSGKYVVYYHKGNYDGIADCYPLLLEKIKMQGYCVCGDAHEEYVIAERATKNTDDFTTKITVQVI